MTRKQCRWGSVTKALAFVAACFTSSFHGENALAFPSERLAPTPRGHLFSASDQEPSSDWQARPRGAFGAAFVLAQAGNPPQAPSEAEMQMRIELLKRSMGFGGIFGPMLQGRGASDSTGGNAGDECLRRGYTDYAACQAYKAGDGWAADRLQRRDSSGSERDWYNR